MVKKQYVTMNTAIPPESDQALADAQFRGKRSTGIFLGNQFDHAEPTQAGDFARQRMIGKSLNPLFERRRDFLRLFRLAVPPLNRLSRNCRAN